MSLVLNVALYIKIGTHITYLRWWVLISKKKKKKKGWKPWWLERKSSLSTKNCLAQAAITNGATQEIVQNQKVFVSHKVRKFGLLFCAQQRMTRMPMLLPLSRIMSRRFTLIRMVNTTLPAIVTGWCQKSKRDFYFFWHQWFLGSLVLWFHYTPKMLVTCKQKNSFGALICPFLYNSLFNTAHLYNLKHRVDPKVKNWPSPFQQCFSNTDNYQASSKQDNCQSTRPVKVTA